MAKNRTTINALAKQLCDLIDEGGSILPQHKDMARRLRELAGSGGTFVKQYHNSHEERVLYRHLNLYRNKLEKAETEVDRNRWKAKIADQKAKIAAFEIGQDDDMDLDGL